MDVEKLLAEEGTRERAIAEFEPRLPKFEAGRLAELAAAVVNSPAEHLRVLAEAQRAGTAEAAAAHLVTWIQQFEAGLNEEEEVGLRLVSFGQSVVLHLEGIAYRDPSLISFFGRRDDDGARVQLIQHLSQISVLLLQLPRLDPTRPAGRIGFQATQQPQDAPVAGGPE